ncbi:MAG TPA: MarR family transcriptional regulator [Leptospiraceae bacterium]|jgi:DNA-binding MarR family transcriptional regulator|nr:MarR family transcriptional regulator [Leptospiraceae bacterium]HMW61980.1 MarR family transcriptional regulator [Leptospiraceae bacterium]HNE23289.1 MarR family transcriptional regulator [Leptospiraceae bacterium]HNL70685.1 MarR family transcriptional regulator [Leptospiraceae bacterium]
MKNRQKPDPVQLKSHIGYHLRVISNAVSHSFARKLAATDVTVAECVILREMYAGNQKTSPGTVAEITGLTRGAVSKLVDRLLNKGLVTRTESSRDRRFQEIQLTPRAARLVPQLARIADENDESFFSILSQGEKKALVRTLVKLATIHRLNAHPIE